MDGPCSQLTLDLHVDTLCLFIMKSFPKTVYSLNKVRSIYNTSLEFLEITVTCSDLDIWNELLSLSDVIERNKKI